MLSTQSEARALTRTKIISELSRSEHGDLKGYIPVGAVAAAQDIDFFSHLIAWDREKGQIRDSKVALPVIALGAIPKAPAQDEYLQNALAHIALLDPRSLSRALTFVKEVRLKSRIRRQVRNTVERYLRVREQSWPWWERAAIQHRASMKTLYASLGIKPSAMAQQVLFDNKYPADSMFAAVANLKNMPPAAAGAVIINKRLPFLVVTGALGAKAKDPDLMLAMIESMTPNELVNSVAMLKKLGVENNPATRGAFTAALEKLTKPTPKGKKAPTLKMEKAAAAVAAIGGATMAKRLEAAQEKQLDQIAVEGNWLVLGDRSGSMAAAIETAKEISAILARVVKGSVYLIFFDDTPQFFDATGKTLEQIKEATRGVRPGGSTSIGCGLAMAIERGLEIDGIAIVSDGGENCTPLFCNVLTKYQELTGREPAVYLYLTVGGAPNTLSPYMNAAGLHMQTFDVRSGVDYYSLPNLVQTMRAKRWSLVDEIMEMPLLTLEGVFSRERTEAA